MKTNCIYDEYVIKAIKSLTAESSKLKMAMCKSVITNHSINVNKGIVNHYISYINNLLMQWEEISKQLSIDIKSANGSEYVRTIDYDYIKDFVYAEYDYASILNFVDGIIKGISKGGKFRSPEDVNDFFEQTVAKAFKGRSDSVAGLLNSVITSDDSIFNIISTDNYEAKMFNSVKSYNKLFNSRDRIELYKAVQKTVEYMCLGEFETEVINPENMRYIVNIINTVIEYITYSTTAYITRIFILYKYARPFIVNMKDIKVLKEYGDNCSCDKITLMRDLDDGIVKDIKKVKETFRQLEQFTTMIGADYLFKTNKPSYDRRIDCFSVSSNKFTEKLLSNPLYELISKTINVLWYENSVSFGSDLNEYNNILRDSIYNTNHALSETSTHKHEIMYVIKTIKINDTVAGCRELAADLLKFANIFMINIEDHYKSIIKIAGEIYNSYIPEKENKQNMLSDCMNMLIELYTDISMAIVNRFRDIEADYNELNCSCTNDVLKGFDLSINKITKTLSTNNTSNSVPDTMRTPVDIADMYSLPSFESLQMYSEYVTSLPEFKDDPYFSESAFTSIFNSLKSLLKGIFKYFETAYLDKSFQAAINYVMKNESTLLSLPLNNVTMEVMPYKNDDNITPPKEIWTNIQNALNNLDLNSINSKEDITKFIRTLYPNETVYSWFYGDKANVKTAEIKFRNWMLFEDNVEQVKDTEYQKISISGNDVKTRMKNWIETVKGSRTLYDQLKKIDQDFENALKGVETKLVNASNPNSQQSTSNNNQNNTPPAPLNTNVGSDNNTSSNSSSTNNSTQQNQQNQNSNYLNTLLTEVQIATERMWRHSIKIFVVYLREEYNYIRDAYSKANQK